MTAVQIFSLALLVATFAVALWRGVNVGLAMLPAAYLLAEVAHVPLKTLYAGFPASLVVVVLGVMYLVGHAVRSGAVDRMVHAAERVVGRRDWVLPWISFLLAGAISAIGALPVAALAVVLPISMQTARRRDIDPVLMATVTIQGAMAGGFSPISVWGQLVRTLSAEAGYDVPTGRLFLLELLLNTALGVVAFVVLRGVALVRRGRRVAASAGPQPVPVRGAAGPSRYEVASVVAVLVFVVAVLVLKLDVGLTAFALGALVHAGFVRDDRQVVADLPWAVVLVLAGVLTYVGVLLKVGALQVVSAHLQGIGSTALSVLALAYFASVFASFESSQVAVLAVVVPVTLQVALTLPQHGTLVLLVLAAAACSAVVTSTSPFHVSGALAVASSGEAGAVVFRRLLLWTVAVAAAVPLVVSLLPLATLA